MAIDVTSVRTLLAVNGIGPESSDDEKSKILAAAKYSPEEITAALAALSAPPPAPSIGKKITVPKGKKVPYEMRASAYPAVKPVVTEHPVLGTMVRLVITIGLLLAVAAALYATAALSYPARWLSMDVFCKGVPAGSVDACVSGARPETSPWFEEAQTP